MGGRRGLPGSRGVHTHMSNTRNTPVEAIEHYLPVRIRQYASAARTAPAPARSRGGEGHRARIRDADRHVRDAALRAPPRRAVRRAGRRARRDAAATRSIRDGQRAGAARARSSCSFAPAIACASKRRAAEDTGNRQSSNLNNSNSNRDCDDVSVLARSGSRRRSGRWSRRRSAGCSTRST